MYTLTARQQETYTAPPAAILAQALSLREFDGVPTLMVDTDTLPATIEGLGPHFEAMLNDRATGPQDPDCVALMNTLMQTQDIIMRKVTAEPHHHGHIVPVALWASAHEHHQFADAAGADHYRPLAAAIVFTPHADYQPDDLLCTAGIHTGETRPDFDNTALCYWITHHELAHVAGADEPQADMIASLFTRRAFPDDPAVQMMADMRAVVQSHKAVLAHMHPDHAPLRQDITDYGWPMVDAIDTVLAMDQATIDAMDDDAILAHRYARPDRDPARLLTLGEIFAKATGELDCRVKNADGQTVLTKKRCPLFATGSLSLIAQAAQFMADKTDNYTDDPAIKTMATRAAQAAERLEAFYTAPPRSLQ